MERHSILLKVWYKIFALIQWNCFFSLLSHNPPINIALKTQNHVCSYIVIFIMAQIHYVLCFEALFLDWLYCRSNTNKKSSEKCFFLSKPSASPEVWRQMRSRSLCVFVCLTLTFCRERHKVIMHFFEVSFNHKIIVVGLYRSFGAKVENLFSFSYWKCHILWITDDAIFFSWKCCLTLFRNLSFKVSF